MEMSSGMIYRRQLLQAVDAFLEGTPSARVRAQRIIQRCFAAIHSEAKESTLDKLIWNNYVTPLSDSDFYESEAYLRETREILLGQSPQNIARRILSEDFRPAFTADEAEWYAQLLSMVEFLRAIPYAQIHAATFQAWQQRDTWATTRTVIPEAVQADEAEADYQRRKALIEALAAKSPSPEQMGDEKIYHVVLREVTTLITSIRVGMAAVVCGYPVLTPPYSGATASEYGLLNMSERLTWIKRALEALEGKDAVLLSWRLSKAATFDADVLLLSLT
jgi:hypothetical protein